MENEIIICACNSTEHQIVLLPIEEDNYREVYVHVHLNKRPFLYRIKYALKYIFGYQCKYGAFDEIILDDRNIEKFKKAIKFIENDVK